MTWTEFLLKPAGEMAKVNPLRDLRGKLSDSDYEQAVRMVAESRQGHASPLAAEGLSFEQRAQAAARSAGIIPSDEAPGKWSDDQRQGYDAFRLRLEGALSAAEQAKGSKLTVEEKQAVTDHETIQLNLSRSHFGVDLFAQRIEARP